MKFTNIAAAVAIFSAAGAYALKFMDKEVQALINKGNGVTAEEIEALGAPPELFEHLKNLTGTNFTKEQVELAFIRIPAVKLFAKRAHEEWREGYIKKNGNVPRIKPNPSDKTEGDINKPLDEIHPDHAKENLDAGEAAFDAFLNNKDDIEAAADKIHQKWMARPANKLYEGNKAQHVPYTELPDAEKEKDRIQYQIMKDIIGLEILAANSKFDFTIAYQEHETPTPVNSGYMPFILAGGAIFVIAGVCGVYYMKKKKDDGSEDTELQADDLPRMKDMKDRV